MENKEEQTVNSSEDLLKKDPWSTILGSYSAASINKSSLKESEGSHPFIYKRIPLLEAIYDKFQRSLTTNLHHFVDDNALFDIKFRSLNSVHFDDYIKSINQPGIVGVFNAIEWQSEGLVFINYNIVTIIVDALSGAQYSEDKSNEGIIIDQSRQYSKLERKIIERIITLVLSTFSDSFEPLCQINFDVESIESDPSLALITKGSSIVTVAHLTLEVGPIKGVIEIILPYTTLEPIKNLLIQNFMGEKFGSDPVWEQHMIQQILATDVTLEVKLPEVKSTIKEILQWKTGTQIPFECTEASSMDAFCRNHKVFKGKIGQKGRKVAFCIEDVFFKEKGEHP